MYVGHIGTTMYVNGPLNGNTLFQSCPAVFVPNVWGKMEISVPGTRYQDCVEYGGVVLFYVIV